MRKRSAERDWLEEVPCSTCKAQAGHPCQSAGGPGKMGTAMVHVARKRNRTGPRIGAPAVPRLSDLDDLQSRPCSACRVRPDQPCAGPMVKGYLAHQPRYVLQARARRAR